MDAGSNNPNNGNNGSGNNSGNTPPSYDPAEKEKYVNGGYSYMVHWYKAHPDEIGELIPDNAEHDAEWYQQNPKRIGDLVRNRIQQEKKDLSIDADDLKKEFDQNKRDELERIKNELDQLRLKLANLSAKSRMLFIGPKYRAELQTLGEKYGEKFDYYLKIKTEITTTDKFDQDLGNFLESHIEQARNEIDAELTKFVGGDLNNPNKTKSEIKAEKMRLVKEHKDVLNAEYFDKVQDKVTEANINFVEDYVDQKNKFEHDTNEAIDKGGKYRKFVHYVINNKKLKNVLAGAAVVGLAATGVGLATGAIVATSSYTGVGVALGALKGAIGGFLGSRQDYGTSNIKDFVSQEQIEEQLKGIDPADQTAGTKNVTDWLLGEYYKASEKDHKSNRTRTLVATGLGALFGMIMSGVHIKTPRQNKITYLNLNGEHQAPVKLNSAAQFDQVDVPKGKGLFNVFSQMGGEETNQQRALEIAESICSKYSNVQPGPDGLAEIYPGKIADWPSVAKSYITEVSEAWVKEGLVPPAETAGTIGINFASKPYISYVTNAFTNFLTDHIVPVVGSSLLGGVIGEIPSKASRSRGRTAMKAALRANASSDGSPQAQNKPDSDPQNSENLKRIFNSLSPAEQSFFFNVYYKETPIDANQINTLWSQMRPDIQNIIIEQEKARQGQDKGRDLRIWLRDNQQVDIQP